MNVTAPLKQFMGAVDRMIDRRHPDRLDPFREFDCCSMRPRAACSSRRAERIARTSRAPGSAPPASQR